MMKIKKSDLFSMKYYLVFLAVVVTLYITASVTGFTFFSAKSEQWSPAGRNAYHK